VRFELVDVMNDAGGRERLRALGARGLPVLARGKEYVFGQRIEEVARFIGMTDYRVETLAPDVLIAKWTTILRAAQRIIRQFPRSCLEERVHEARDQSIRHMGYHTLRIGDAFLATAIDGVEDWVKVSMEMPPRTLASADEVACYGDGVIERLQRWWAAQEDRSCARPVKTNTGVQSLREFLERQTWHSAQHVRQLVWRLEKMGITPDAPPSSEDLAGLPMPQAVWG
jgi:hypothetical protein